MNSSTSLSLLRQIQSGAHQEDAWSEFVARYGSRIYEWCLNRNLQPSDAEDVSQNVLIKLARALRTFEYRQTGSFRGWLRRVTENTLVDFFRDRQRKQGATSIRAEQLDSMEARQDLIERIESAFDLEIMDTAIQQVRDRISEKRFRAWEMAALQGLAARDIAGQLGMKIASVYTARNQVQELIRQSIQGLEKELDLG